MEPKLLLVMFVFASQVGCGGDVKESDEDTATDAKTATSSTNSSSNEQAAEADSSDTRRLQDCVEGFDPLEEPERPCTWLGDDGLCYDTMDAACDCVCPRDHDSYCISEFPKGEGGRTEVYCS